ncbi:MAG: aspartate/glutamate racemase family protein [Treponema sp.]|nr:aspartate/glutamate racemase family protein [Treponema sp.]MBQ2552170.1 aspartate/glutamate racemase family protein [Treponema sp.]MBQ4236753.1 aspartate/glutamate racemase family protein [Treponema sp.]MBQ5383561.1 aspartate/glutamate racemase family protein [Treponema sp.]
MHSTKNRIAIGIVGGLGPYAGLDLEKKVFDSVDAQSDQDYPDVMMISAPSLITDRSFYIMHPETDNPCTGIEYVIQKLSDAGATHIAIPCNTAHAPIIMNQVRRFIEINGIDVKLFNIVEETYKWVRGNCSSRDIVLYATKGTYWSGVYRNLFENDSDYRIIEPDDDDKELIWESIYNRDFGIKAFSNPVKEQALENLMSVTKKMIGRGYDTFIMGCTEIPLAMGRFNLPITLVDPAKILARALVSAVCPERLKEP